MGIQHGTRRKSSLTTTGMLYGGMIGGLVCAFVRGGITLFNLQGGAEIGFLASLPSAGIGFLCGAVAGSFCRWPLGAMLGAFLSAGVFGLFVIPVAYVFSLFGAAHDVGTFTFSFFIQKAFAGAIAGGIGGYTGMLIVRSENRENAMTQDRPDALFESGNSNPDRT